VRYIFHKHDYLPEMLNYKLEMKDLAAFKIAYSEGGVDFGTEAKVDKKNSMNNLTYSASCTFKLGFYRAPLAGLINAYFPMFVLAFLGLMIF
jgi:hypothetical protein